MGPIIVHDTFLKFPKQIKVYVATFVCLCTKAIHMEIVTDLSTPSFVAALDRFTARRNVPHTMWSDNGTNFVGAGNLFEESMNPQDPELLEFCREFSIKFNFYPPAAPFQNGICESAVRCAKWHLKRVAGTRILVYQEFETLMVRIEAILNSRPLTPLSHDPNDLRPLTPGHFLVGRPLRCIQRPRISPRDLPRIQHWDYISGLLQSFWDRWSKEYLLLLQTRPKWFKNNPNLVIDKLVLVDDPDLPPLKWKMARVIAVHPGPDGKVRVATIRTQTGELQRPVHKLYPLPCS